MQVIICQNSHFDFCITQILNPLIITAILRWLEGTIILYNRLNRQNRQHFKYNQNAKVKALKRSVWKTTQILLSCLKTPQDDYAGAGGWFYGVRNIAVGCVIICPKYASPIHKPDSSNVVSNFISCIAAQIPQTLALPSLICSWFGSEILKIVSLSSPVFKNKNTHLCIPEARILQVLDEGQGQSAHNKN